MTYLEWESLLGVPANAPAVVALLAANGVTAPVTLRRDELKTNVDVVKDGMSIAFTSEYALRGGVADLPIVSAIIMLVVRAKISKGLPPYVGPLPHGLDAKSSRDATVARLGEPLSTDDDLCTAVWSIEGQRLSVRFGDGWTGVKQVSLSIPRQN